MRIAIVTLVGNFNYGNRLQNYALQKVLESLGNEVLTIKMDNFTKKATIATKVRNTINNGEIVTKIFKKLFSQDTKKKKALDEIRLNNFSNFTHKFINVDESFAEPIDLVNGFDSVYDCSVIGSDQVWNYSFDTFSKLYFSDFSKKPKLSYAASFGVESIPDSLQEMYKEGLQNLDYISVRESAGVDIVKKLTGKDAATVLDPTLLLDSKDWNKISARKLGISHKYILTYFLDPVNGDTKGYIEKLAKENDLVVKNLMDWREPALWTCAPGEFLSLIKQAEMVFTDSFHASVFSIIYNKYFEVFRRNNSGPSMTSRLDTLFNNLNLEDRWHSNDSVYTRIDYEKVNRNLEKLKKKSLFFLSDSLSHIQN